MSSAPEPTVDALVERGVQAGDTVRKDIDLLLNSARTSPPLRDAVVRLEMHVRALTEVMREAERERDEIKRQFDELDAYRGATAALRSNERRMRELEAGLRKIYRMDHAEFGATTDAELVFGMAHEAHRVLDEVKAA